MRALEPIGPDARVLPFRRPPAAVRARRTSRWRTLLAPAAKALVLFGAPVGTVVWLLTAPTFAFAQVDVAGARFVEPRRVEQSLSPLVGENLWRLSLPAVERLVLANPWVESARIEKRPPNALHIELVERQPAALLRTLEGLVVLDGKGRPIAPWEPRFGGSGLLLVSIGSATEVDLGGALAVAGELERVSPAWGRTLSEVEVLADDEFRLYLGAVQFPLAVRAGTLGERLPALAALLPELERRYPAIAQVDLRFERRIVFQPIAERS